MMQLNPFSAREPSETNSGPLPRDEPAALELELTPEELLQLSPGDPTPSPTKALIHSPIGLQSARTVASAILPLRRLIAQTQRSPARAALLISALFAAAWMSIVMHRHPPSHHTASDALGPVAITAARIEPRPQSSGEGLPVRFRNPFDRGEVFTFPAGTSFTEARAEVADVLMKRAHERLSRQPQLTQPHRTSHDPLMAARATIPRSLPSP